MLLISIVMCPSNSGSKGVTFTMMPQRAYVLLPRHIASTSRGILKYSIVLPSANEFGGTMHTLPLKSMVVDGWKFFGSMTLLLVFVNILNSSLMRMS